MVKTACQPARRGYRIMPWVIGGIILSALALSSCQPAAPAPEGWQADGVIKSDEYTGMMSYEAYEIHWDSDGQHIFIAMRAPAEGWVAVGFAPNPLHRETDTVIGFVKDGAVNVFDMFSTAELGPCSMDTELGGGSDILESGGKEEGGYTTIEFKRLLDTGDEYDGALVPGMNEIIWAYSNLDDERGHHLERGRAEIEL